MPAPNSAGHDLKSQRLNAFALNLNTSVRAVSSFFFSILPTTTTSQSPTL